MAGYIGAQGQIRSGLSATIDELNIIDGVTSTTAELNILDGVTATAAEINLIDGGTARGTTAVADGDGFLTNDGGTMRMTKVDTLATYMGTKIGGGAMELIATLTASNSSTLDFTGFDASTYSNYQFYFQCIKPNTQYIALRALASTDGGSNYATSDYQGGSTSNILLNNTSTLGDHNSSSGILDVYDPADTTGYTTFVSRVARNHSGDSSILVGGSCVTHYKVKTAVNAIRFLPSAGNLTSGRILCYGIKI